MRVRGAGRSPGGDGGEGVPGVARGFGCLCLFLNFNRFSFSTRFFNF